MNYFYLFIAIISVEIFFSVTLNTTLIAYLQTRISVIIDTKYSAFFIRTIQ